MKPCVAWLAWLAFPALALAQQTSPPDAAAPAPASRTPEPKVQRIVVQDDHVRIEEERVRGVTRRVVVKPKDAAAYQVLPATAARDPSQAHTGSEGATGKRVWNVLNF
jgi:hypothetical protein